MMCLVGLKVVIVAAVPVVFQGVPKIAVFSIYCMPIFLLLLDAEATSC